MRTFLGQAEAVVKEHHDHSHDHTVVTMGRMTSMGTLLLQTILSTVLSLPWEDLMCTTMTMPVVPLLIRMGLYHLPNGTTLWKKKSITTITTIVLIKIPGKKHVVDRIMGTPTRHQVGTIAKLMTGTATATATATATLAAIIGMTMGMIMMGMR
jgi:hypothetical protein